MMSAAGESRRQVLRVNLMHFFDEMPHLFPNGKKIQSAIIPILIGEAEAAVAESRRLSEKGFLVPAIRFPTVARDTARLRVTLSARHTHAQISALCEALKLNG